MFRRRTLFVVGAGASAEFEMPVGSRLASIIRQKTDIRFEFNGTEVGEGDYTLFHQIAYKNHRSKGALQQAALRVRDRIILASSIDDFLDIHRADPLVNLYGKAAIVRSILEAERSSTLFFGAHGFDEVFNPEKSSNAWIAHFFRMLSRGVAHADIRNIFKNVSFIIFIYDRCIEYYLENALKKLYGIDDRTATRLTRSLTIIHPYGDLGNTTFGQDRVDYRSLAEQIKTYTEQIQTPDMREQIYEEVHSAETIVFLGFAYHEQNMALLSPEVSVVDQITLGTAFGMSDSDLEVTTQEILRWRGPEARGIPNTTVRIKNNLTCAELFNHFTKTLMAAGPVSI